MAGETAPRTQPARIEPVNAPAPPEPKTAPEGGLVDADKVVAPPRAGTLARRRRCHGEPLPDAARAHVDWRIGIEAQYSTERRYSATSPSSSLSTRLRRR